MTVRVLDSVCKMGS